LSQQLGSGQLKKLLMLGGSYQQIPAIEYAREAGHYVVLCDYLDDNPGRNFSNEYLSVSTTDKDKVLGVAQKRGIDGIIAYASDPAAPTAAYVAGELKLPGNSYASVNTLSNKYLFRQFLKSNGFMTPDFKLVNSFEELFTISENCSFPKILKPTDSSGSKGVILLNNNHDIKRQFDYSMNYSKRKELILEDYIETPFNQLHGDGFVANGKLAFVYLGDHHYDTRINQFVPFSTTWPSLIPTELMNKAIAELNQALKLSGFKEGPINIEIRLTQKADVVIMEIGPRSGGNFTPVLLSHLSGVDLVKKAIDSSLGIMSQEFNCSEFKSGAYFVLHSGTKGSYRGFSFSNGVEKYIFQRHIYKKNGDPVEPFHGASSAIGVFLLEFGALRECDTHELIRTIQESITLS
jgi:biotin carboxylase